MHAEPMGSGSAMPPGETTYLPRLLKQSRGCRIEIRHRISFLSRIQKSSWQLSANLRAPGSELYLRLLELVHPDGSSPIAAR